MTESGRFEDCLSLNLSFSNSFIGFLLCFATLIATMTTAQEPLASMTKSVNDFTLDLYLATAEGKEGSNVLVSPLSAALATLMVHAGAKGVTADEISRGLHLPSDKTTLESGIKALHDILSNTPNVTLEVANKIFLEKSKTLAPKYQEIVTSVHKSDVKLADFIKESEKERVNINNWVSKKTHDKIKDLLPAGSVKSDTRLVLVNALYFFGKWKHEFDRSDTSDEDFHVSKTKTVKVPMMHQTKNMRYAEIPELDAKAVELCYVNEQVCLQIILPNAKDGLEALHSKLRTRSFDLSNIEFYSTKVQLSLPKFKMEETINLKDIYQKMGIREMFSSKADLTGMIEGNEPLAVSEAIQKTFIEVNEQGTEAAAATGFAIVALSAFVSPDPIKFVANHPFVLRLHSRRVSLFVGGVTSPSPK